ncbi:hypothetical protein V6N13_138329 [Hibiscus sabdariffa]
MGSGALVGMKVHFFCNSKIGLEKMSKHFLSCCSRMLGLSYQSQRGYIGIEYYGQTVAKVVELHNKFRGQTVMLGVDDMDIFKGISVKLLAMEQLLMQHTENTCKVVLVQIVNPARGRGRDVQEDLEKACGDHLRKRCCGIGFSLGF